MAIEIPILKGKSIAIGSPHRVELILIFMYATLLLWFDVLANKVLDLGVNYRVTWFNDITSRALDLSVIILIAFHLVLMGLFLMSLRSKATHRTFDIIIGTMAFFGIAIVLAGFVNNINSETIRFLFIDMSSVNFYHLGIALEFIAVIYWAFTK